MVNANSNRKEVGKVIVEEVQIEVDEDEVEPPLQYHNPTFNTLQDWLLNICQSNHPKKSIAKYQYLLFESSNGYDLALVGVNTYNKTRNCSVVRIDFKPKNMYFRLSQPMYKNLSRPQLIDKLTAQLRGFASTKEFGNSFFVMAEIVVFETNGQIIWSK